LEPKIGIPNQVEIHANEVGHNPLTRIHKCVPKHTEKEYYTREYTPSSPPAAANLDTAPVLILSPLFTRKCHRPNRFVLVFVGKSKKYQN
jgi:hypothetical protein